MSICYVAGTVLGTLILHLILTMMCGVDAVIVCISLGGERDTDR